MSYSAGMKLETIQRRLSAMTRPQRMEIARHAGITLRQIDRLRAGTNGPRHSTYQRLVEALRK